MILNILLLIVGFVLLIKGADFFIDGASSTANNFKVSKTLIGLTIIAFGTSAPEFAISIQSLSMGSTDMLFGNVIGSNIINILLILGIAALIHPIKIEENTIKKELPLCMLISVLLVVLFLDIKLANGVMNQITRADAFIILLFFTIFLYYLITLTKEKKKEKDIEKPKYKLIVSLLIVVGGLLGIIFGSNLVVNNASAIASKIGLSDRIIALTVVALGTSLPELVTTIVASKKKEQNLLLGNIIGSNIFNACVVLGIPIALYGTVTPTSFSYIDLIVLIFSSFLLFIFANSKKTITRIEGLFMVIAFFIYYSLVFII